MKVLIVGYGNMGKTYARSFINSRFIKAEDIFVLSRSQMWSTVNEGISEKNFITQVSKTISKVDIVIIAVKPQDFSVLAAQIVSFVQPHQLILSVMAGVTLFSISEKLFI